MKKFFKNLALASLAIAGILVSSCKIEDIKTTFEPKKAEARIVVTVLDALHANEDVSERDELKIDASSTSNSVLKIDGNEILIEGTPAIQEQTVTINAEYKGIRNTKPVTLKINSVLAGGAATYSSTVIVGEVIEAVATATVQVSVWDNVSGKDVTKEATYSYSGVPSGYTVDDKTKGSYIITCKDGISAFNFEITATYGGNSNKAIVAIDDIAKAQTQPYGTSIKVGTAPEPVKTPAVAKIHVVVIDGLLQKEITEKSTITADIVGTHTEKIEYEGNLVTITAGESLKIGEVSVLINAKYDELEDSTIFKIDGVSEGAVVDYTTSVIFNDPAKYYPEKVSEKVIDVEVGTLRSAHNLPTYTHDYSHATTGYGHGTGEWLYNESEFILNTTIDYENEYGTDKNSVVDLSGCTTRADYIMVDYYSDALIGKGYLKEPAQREITVSAFAMYSAFCTKTTTAHKYNIVRRESEKDDVVVGSVTVYTKYTQCEYCEAAIPGHEGHYHFGHGHDDVHGRGNAGGGIIDFE